jgi:hypothetical protein
MRPGMATCKAVAALDATAATVLKKLVITVE